MPQYCVECKWAGAVSGDDVYCTLHGAWVPKYSGKNCPHYVYKHSHHPLLVTWLGLLLCKLGIL